MAVLRYPAGPITPHGAWHVINGRLPLVWYQSGDGAAVFNLSGGPAIPDRTMPEAVTLTDIKGLIPPWTNIEQKGATQDGSTYITSLYEPCDIDLTLRVHGRNPQYTRQVMRDWIDAWDAKQTGALGVYTHGLGNWWLPVHWAKPPVDAYTGGFGNTNTQRLVWAAKAYDPFWRSTPDVAVKQGNGQLFLPRINVGDQPRFDTYTCVGPGTFAFRDGPTVTDYVTFGPLLANQIAQVRTDPRKRGVVDLTSQPASPQDVNISQNAIADFLSFATAGNLPAMLIAIESLFGINPPQGVPLYSLLHGRFSDNAAIPPKPRGAPAPVYNVLVSISGGNSNSAIIASGTPLRRIPW